MTTELSIIEARAKFQVLENTLLQLPQLNAEDFL